MRHLPFLLLLGCTAELAYGPGDTDAAFDTDPGGLPATFALDGDDLFPDSGVFDPTSQAFVLGSLARGELVRHYVDGTQDSLFLAQHPEHWSVRGVAADLYRGRLWACAWFDDDSTRSYHVWRHDMASGGQTQRYDLANAHPNARCHDLAVAGDGTVYVTDPSDGRVLSIDPIEGTVDVLANHSQLAGGQVGASGIAITPAGDALLIARYSNRLLYRLDLADPTRISELRLTGDTPGLAASEGYDGLTMHGGALYVAAISTILKITPTDSGWTDGVVQRIDIDGGGYSAVTPADGWVYAIQSDPIAWTLGIRPDLPFSIRRVPER